MIKGEKLIINRKGISISNKRMEDIRIYPESQIYMLPMRSFEYQEHESAREFPIDLFVTPIPPEKWPFVMRFNIRLRNRPGTFKKVYEFFEKLQINVISSETIRSGHHHDTLNVLGEIRRLEVKSLKSIFKELKDWKKDRENIYRKMYSKVYEVDGLTHYFTGNKYKVFKNKLNEKQGKEKAAELLEKIERNYSKDSDKYYFDLAEVCRIYKGFKHDFLEEYEDIMDFVKKNIRNEEGDFYTPMWYDIIEKYTEKAGELENDKCSICSETHKKKREKRLKELEKELDNLYITKDPSKKKETEEKKEFNKLLGEYLAYQYCDQKKITIGELLEKEIERARRKVLRIDKNNPEPSKDKYFMIQKEILILKVILSTIITYKKMLDYRYKLLLVEDSLKCENYIYNIRYYENILQYPYFAEKAILHSSLKNQFWKTKMIYIIGRLECLPERIENEWMVDPAYNLDPINISPLEFLSHSFYHRVYEKDLTAQAENSHIPFPSKFPVRLLDKLFPEGNLSIYGIASFNSDTLSCRICPIPLKNLKHFAEIEMRKNRSCNDGCIEHGKKNLIKSNDKDNSMFLKENNLHESRGQLPGSENHLNDDIFCNGSSMGLMSTWLKALGDDSKLKEKYEITFNIWRTFNKTTRLDDEREKGEITVWAHAMGNNLPEFPTDIRSLIENDFTNCLDKSFGRKGHLKVEDIKVKKFFSGKIFVSLRLEHPMSRVWLDYIKKIGNEFGFSDIDTTMTFTKPVTEKVLNDIGNSLAMIQILSLPEKSDDQGKYNSSPGLAWLYAEYLTAVNLGKVVIRLIDMATIEKDKVIMGKDHMNLEFSRMKPFSDFEKQVEKAFSEIRKELLDTNKI